jgi:aspartate/methionine/tyrosine aminotransferase
MTDGGIPQGGRQAMRVPALPGRPHSAGGRPGLLPGSSRASWRPGSLLTRYEQALYRDGRGLLNAAWGYPAGLNPGWIAQYQLHPPGDFLAVSPGEYLTVIEGYFRDLFGCDVTVAPSCTLAFAVAARAVLVSPRDEVIVAEPTYDGYADILESQAQVIYVPRGADGSLSIGSIAGACGRHTRAVVLAQPENPLGIVYPQPFLEDLAGLCQHRGLTLVVDHCLAGLSPPGAEVPLVSRLAGAGEGLQWLAVGDTGKILGLRGAKFGAVACPGSYRQAVEAAASVFWLEHDQYALYVVSAVLSDGRFPAYLDQLNAQITANWAYLRGHLSRQFRVEEPEGGCFALADVARLGLDDLSYATLLAGRYGAAVTPLMYLRAGHEPTTQVRIALSRPREVIRGLADAMNQSARDLRP